MKRIKKGITDFYKEEVKCKFCDYFQPIGDYDQGTCHRRAPTSTGFGRTSADSFCGEFTTFRLIQPPKD